MSVCGRADIIRRECFPGNKSLFATKYFFTDRKIICSFLGRAGYVSHTCKWLGGRGENKSSKGPDAVSFAKRVAEQNVAGFSKNT